MTTDREKFVPDDQFDREIFLTFNSFSCVMLAVAVISVCNNDSYELSWLKRLDFVLLLG